MPIGSSAGPARIAIEHTARAEWKDRVLKETNPLGALEGMPWRSCGRASGEICSRSSTSCLAMMKHARPSPRTTSCGCSARSCTRRQRSRAVSALRSASSSTDLLPASSRRPGRAAQQELALLIGYSGQAPGIAELLAAMPKGNENQELQLHYLYALRMIKQGWTSAQKVAARRGARSRGKMARRSAVHQLRRAVLRLRRRSVRDRRRETTAVRKGARLLATDAGGAEGNSGAPGSSAAAGRGGRGGRGGPADSARRADRRDASSAGRR